MAKSRRKKNYKLRRRVMRTIAALTMIMAIVVAAIPVENYGTMRAMVAEKSIAEIYTEEMRTSPITSEPYEKKQPADLKDKYNNGTDVVLQRIDDNKNLYDVFSAKKSGSDVMITEYIARTNIPNLEINPYECIGYVYWNTSLPNNIHTAYNNETIEIAFANDATSSENTYTSSQTTTKSVTIPKKISLGEDGLQINKNITAKSTMATEQTEGQYTANTNGTISSLDVFKNCYAGLYDNRIESIKQYNAVIDELNNTLGANSTTLTDAQIDTAQQKVDDLDVNLKTLSRALLQDDSNDSALTDVDQYIIRRSYKNANNNDLQKCNIVKINRVDPTNGVTSSYYAPQLIENTEEGKISGQYSDANGYLASESVKVDAIDKFGTRQVGSVKISADITFISEGAFKDNEYISSVEINTDSCSIISDEAFKGCINLTSVKFSQGRALTTIGKEAFAASALSGDVEIPNNVKDIGAGAFSGTSIGTLKFAGGNGARPVKICPYAFYNCANLQNVEFPGDTKYQIYQGAFAIGDSAGGAMTKFEFPAMNETMEQTKGDYILAGRNALKDVTFAGNLTGKIPSETLMGCTGLTRVYFPDGAYGATYNPVATTNSTPVERGLFEDVQLLSFYVEGPGYMGNTTSGQGITAQVRETTWSAVTGLGNKVPYRFTDENGEHFEYGEGKKDDGSPKYIATLDVKDGKATLSSYINHGRITDDNIRVELPKQVGDYPITAIGKDCFNQDVKDKLAVLIIQDDSVERIEEGAFQNAKNLKWVEIGGAVEFIGRDAFKGCDCLENVVFSKNHTKPYNSIHVIEDDSAFATGSEFLTFHGAIDPEYGPYQLAMRDCRDLTGARQICYVTDAPLNLMVIRDNTSGMATLIDYPHYEEIDTINGYGPAGPGESLLQRFEKIQYENGSLDSISGLEERIVNQTLNMDLPNGIASINAKDYLNNVDNAKEKQYFSLVYEPEYDSKDTKKEKPINYTQSKVDRKRAINSGEHSTGTGENKVDDLYSKYSEEKDGIKVVPGLFSGFFDESNIASQDLMPKPTESTYPKGLIWKDYNDHRYTEKHDRGNDYLTSINMATVAELPNYAFDSCENLKTITFDTAMNKIGIQPFRDCKSLYQIETGSNSKYEYDRNMILYDKVNEGGGGGYKIVQGLEGRGRTDQYASDGTYGTKEITAATNPLIAQVTDIAEYAFAENDEIFGIDLSAANVRNILEGTFAGCDNLNEVIFPERTQRIDAYAFKDVNPNGRLRLRIPNERCQFDTNAFEDEDGNFGPGYVVIEGIQYDENGDISTAYDSWEQLKKLYPDKVDVWHELGSTCILTFEDGDTGDLIKKQEVPKGESLENPPTAPDKSGFKFRYWLCTEVRDENGNPLMGEATYSNVTEDRRIRAIYETDPNTTISDGKDYNLTVVNGNAIIGGTMVSTPTTIKGGTPVTIVAKDEKNFQVWTIVPNTQISLLMNPSSPATSFTMPNADIKVTANTAIGGGTDTPNPDGTYTVTVNNGTGSGQYKPGATVTITANKPNAGASFVNWTTATAGVSFAGATSSSTTFVMPSSNVTVTANFSDGSGGQPGGNTPGGDSGKKYKVTVNYGSGSGEYEAGATVNITANAPDSSSRVFSRWTTNNSGLGFANANSVSTSFVMPAADVTVTANYKTRTNDDDDDDDDGPSRRPGTNTTTNTVTNRPGSSTSTTGTNGTVSNPASGTGSDNGNRIYITKNGISNTDVASLAVSGSTDNFIVRITESPEATAAVEQALTNTYGSLNGLAYLPMDISLYDSTGQNKITDTTGLNITVTMPIPDVLIQYGGNARVAAADNGNLQQITPRFTTIDGIACVSFVPPHFSPYVIYVDTNNLIAGNMLDSTPATGDPIHPKWFAAIGMACVSILLFVLSDGRKRRKYRAA